MERRNLAKRLFISLDASGDGSVDIDELSTVLRSDPVLLKVLAGCNPALHDILDLSLDESTKLLVERIDTSGDGSISLSEFMDYFVPASTPTSQSEVQRLLSEDQVRDKAVKTGVPVTESLQSAPGQIDPPTEKTKFDGDQDIRALPKAGFAPPHDHSWIPEEPTGFAEPSGPPRYIYAASGALPYLLAFAAGAVCALAVARR